MPLVKTGGLADVVGALPAAPWRAHGWEMRVLMPAYRALRAQAADWPVVLAEEGLWGGPGRVLAGEVAGCLSCCWTRRICMTARAGPIRGPTGDWPDNPQRFAALSWVAARIAREGLIGWLGAAGDACA